MNNTIGGGGTSSVYAAAEAVFYGTADLQQPLTVTQPVTLTYGAQTASLTGIANPGVFVPQDFSSSALNIPAYVVSNTVTVANTVAYSAMGPFAGEGSLYFPGGTGAYVQIPSSAVSFWPGGLTTFTDGTIEAWIYLTKYNSTSNTIIIGRGVSSGTFDWLSNVSSSGVLTFSTYGGNGTTTGGTVPLNAWNHIAVSSKSNSINVFLNGVISATPITYSGTLTGSSTDPLFISTPLNTINGYIACARIISGQALYTSNFTPPTAPLQPLQGVTQTSNTYGTVLLLRNAPVPGRVLTQKFAGQNSFVGPGSGSVGVLSFPPAAMTGYSTSLNAGYGQGTYVASASSEFSSSYLAWYAFDQNTTTMWASLGALYAATTGIYTASNVTVDVTGTGYNGDLLQIQLPSSIVLSSYFIQSRTDGSGPASTPSTWVILGSRDGTNWYVVDRRGGITWTSGSAQTFYVSSSQAFSYFRFSTQIIQNGGSANDVNFAQWILNGSIEGVNVSADGRLGVGVTAPVQALEVAGSAVVAGTVSSGTGFMFRNRIINGDMRIAQRGTSLTGQTASPYLVDRWVIESSITSGQFSYNQNVLSVSDTPYQQGFRYSSNIVITTALSNYVSCTPRQSIENQNISDFMWGTPFGVPVTVSLWIKTSAAAGSFIPVSVRWGTNYYVYAYNTTGAGPGIWQYISFTVPPPPTTYGTVASDANSGFQLYLGNGYQGTAAVAGTWTSTSQFGSGTQTNTYGTINSYFTWTGVQLEKGTVATPFEFRPYATELALCQRYWEQSYSTGVAAGTNTTVGMLQPYGSTDGSSNFVISQRYIVPKRISVFPTFYLTTGTSGSWNYQSSAASSTSTIHNQTASNEFGFNFYVTLTSAWAACNAYGQWTANAEL